MVNHDQLIEGPKIPCCITTFGNLINMMGLIELKDSRISDINQILTGKVNACNFENRAWF